MDIRKTIIVIMLVLFTSVAYASTTLNDTSFIGGFNGDTGTADLDSHIPYNENNNLTQAGSNPLVTGVFGQAYDIDASNNWATSTATNLSFSGLPEWSTAMWFKSTDSSALVYMLSSGAGSGNFVYSITLESGKVGIRNAFDLVVSPNTYNDGAWHRVVVNLDNPNDVWMLWVDGVNVANTTGIASMSNTNAKFRIGGNHVGASIADADIDEVMVWDRILTDAEIASLNSTYESVYNITHGVATGPSTSAYVNWTQPEDGDSIVNENKTFDYQFKVQGDGLATYNMSFYWNGTLQNSYTNRDANTTYNETIVQSPSWEANITAWVQGDGDNGESFNESMYIYWNLSSDLIINWDAYSPANLSENLFSTLPYYFNISSKQVGTVDCTFYWNGSNESQNTAVAVNSTESFTVIRGGEFTVNASSYLFCRNEYGIETNSSIKYVFWNISQLLGYSLGKLHYNTSDYFEGYIKQYIVFNYTLSTNEIAELYNNGSYTVNPLNETDKAINLTNAYIKLIPFVVDPIYTSLWYTNTSIYDWDNIINASGDFYTDGVESGSMPPNYPLSYYNGWIIGRYPNLSHYNGALTEILIYSENLTATDTSILAGGFANETIIDICGVNSSIYYPLVNFTYRDELTDDLINASATFSLSFDNYETISLFTNISNEEDTQLCINRAPSDYYQTNMSGTITLSSTGYVTENLVIDASNGYEINNTQILDFPLYLVGENDSSTITYTWLTTQFDFVEGTMRIYKCQGDGTKDLVESVPISTGQAVANINLLTTSYAYDVIIDGDVYRDDSYYTCHVESSTSRTYYVNLFPVNYKPTIGLYTTQCSMVKVNDSYVSMSWVQNPYDSSTMTGCLVAYQQTIYNLTEIYRNCTTGTSILRSIPNNTNTYTVRGEITQNNKTSYCADSVTFYNRENAASNFGLMAPFMVAFLVLGLLLLFVGEGAVMLGAGGIGVLIAFGLGIILLPWEWVLSVISLLLVIIAIGRSTKE